MNLNLNGGNVTVPEMWRQERRAYVTTATELGSAEILTIEGLAHDGRLLRLQQAWETVRVAQCGYCQAGQIMAARVKLHPAIASSSDNTCILGFQNRPRPL